MNNSMSWIFLILQQKKINRFNMLFSYLSSHVSPFHNNSYSFTKSSASLYLPHHFVSLIVALFLPWILSWQCERRIPRTCETSGPAFYSTSSLFIFCHPTVFLCRSTWYATMHTLSRRPWPGTNLQSVLWFWNHKHNMLGAQSCPVLQTTISILSGRCSLIHPTALVNNTEVRCTLSMDASHCSLPVKSKKDLTTTQGNLHFTYAEWIKSPFFLALRSPYKLSKST